VFQAKVEDHIVSAQKNHSTIMPHHLPNTSTQLDALNAADHITIQTDHHATVFRAKVEDLIVSAHKNANRMGMILNSGKETDVLSTVNTETVNLEVGTDCTMQ